MVAGQTPKCCGDGGEGEVLGLPGGSQVGVVGHLDVMGEVAVDLSGDRAFQHPQDRFRRRGLAVELSSDEGAGGCVVGHPNQRDPVQCAWLACRSPPRESRM